MEKEISKLKSKNEINENRLKDLIKEEFKNLQEALLKEKNDENEIGIQTENSQSKNNNIPKSKTSNNLNWKKIQKPIKKKYRKSKQYNNNNNIGFKTGIPSINTNNLLTTSNFSNSLNNNNSITNDSILSLRYDNNILASELISLNKEVTKIKKIFIWIFSFKVMEFLFFFIEIINNYIYKILHFFFFVFIIY